MNYLKSEYLKAAVMALMALVLFSGAAAHGDDEDKLEILPKAIVNRSIAVIKDQPLPYVVTGDLAPYPVGPGQPVLFRAALSHKGRNAVEMGRLEVFHTANSGGKWTTVQMKLDPQAPNGWIEKLPGRTTGTTVLVAMLAVNVLGGSLAELACPQNRWPPADSYFKNDCYTKTEAAYAECIESRLPRGCMFALGPEEQPVDDLPSKAGENLDIIDFRMGYDAKYMYFDLTVQGSVDGGSLTPIILNQYTVMMFDPGSEKPEPETGLPLSGVMARFLPLGITAPGFVAPCGVVLNRGEEAVFDSAAAECTAEGAHFLLKVKRDLWGDAPPRELLVFAHTGMLRERNLDQFSFVDRTGLTRVRFGGRHYIVSVIPDPANDENEFSTHDSKKER